MRKDLLVYAVLAIIVGASAVMLPLQAFKVIEEGKTQAKRSMLSAEAEKPSTESGEKGLGSGRMSIQSIFDIGIIVSIGVAVALTATLISKRFLV